MMTTGIVADIATTTQLAADVRGCRGLGVWAATFPITPDFMVCIGMEIGKMATRL